MENSVVEKRFTVLNLLIKIALISSVSFLTLLSCSRGDKSSDVEKCEGENILVFSVEDSLECLKTTLSSGFVQKWASGDQIAIIGVDGKSNKFRLVDGSGTARGQFKGYLTYSDVYVAFYPYSNDVNLAGGNLTFSIPQSRYAASGDIAVGACPMVATFAVGEADPSFKNLFGILEIKLCGTAKVSKIELTDNNSSAMLWGNLSLTIDGNHGTDRQNLSVSGGNNKAYLLYNNPVQLSEGTTTSFYFSLPANTLSDGFSINIYDEDSNIVGGRSTVNDQSILRSHRRSLPALSGIDRIPSSDVYPEPMSWSAYNNLARSGTGSATVIDPQNSGYRASTEKYVGMFYFIWHTANATAAASPLDVQKAMGAGNYAFNDAINYDTDGCGTHHWGEPYLGYYRDDDLWVLRKHAQMLVDAGVDFIAFDVTNNVWYETEITKLLNLYKQMRSEGNKTPQITFIIWHSGNDGTLKDKYSELGHQAAVSHLYDTFYASGTYDDLWFRWEGKPLMMALGNTISSTTLHNYFTFRPSWYIWNNQWQTQDDAGDHWFHDTGSEDKWPWAECYIGDAWGKMLAGTHNGVNEFCPVSPATHPVSNIGRSYPINTGITYNAGANSYSYNPAYGTYFQSQFNAAFELDPKVMFFTGWNEWLMGHFTPGTLEFYYCGGVRAQTNMFIDQYNNEFSRDIEPIKGDFGDNYYYYMADYIRRFKGVNATPVYSRRYYITIDGSFSDWLQVTSCYADDKADIQWRNATQYGRNALSLVNQTGRNDLYKSKVATDGTNLFFYVDALSNLQDYTQEWTGLNLLIKASGTTNWEGFNYIVRPTSATTAMLFTCSGIGALAVSQKTSVSISVSGNAMELSIPLSTLGISNPSSFSVDFKWVDNVNLSNAEGIQQCMRDGDSAPNGRFCYRYVFRY